jgi:hypothetical protein
MRHTGFQERTALAPKDVHPVGCPGPCDCGGSFLQLRSDSCVVFYEAAISNIDLVVYSCTSCLMERQPDGAEHLLLLKGTWASAAFHGAGVLASLCSVCIMSLLFRAHCVI